MEMAWAVRTARVVWSEACARAEMPCLERFEPDWILVSAGYDGHREDPIAEASLLGRDYQMMASAVRAAVPNRRLIFFLEGGYNLAAMERSVTATIAGIAGEAVPSSVRLQSPDGAWRILDLLMKAQRPYWQL